MAFVMHRKGAVSSQSLPIYQEMLKSNEGLVSMNILIEYLVLKSNILKSSIITISERRS